MITPVALNKSTSTDSPPQEAFYLFNEKLQLVARFDRYDSSIRLQGNQGWWLAGIKVSNGVSEPILYDFRHSKGDVATYKVSPCPPKMAMKENFLQEVKKVWQTTRRQNG